jgi:hypothetical protein
VGTAAPRAAPAVTAPPQGSGDDNGFWDKKVEVKDASSVPLKPGFEQPQLQQQPQQQQQVGGSWGWEGRGGRAATGTVS